MFNERVIELLTSLADAMMLVNDWESRRRNLHLDQTHVDYPRAVDGVEFWTRQVRNIRQSLAAHGFQVGTAAERQAAGYKL